MAEEARGRAVNPNCPNAENPFHRCAEYCRVPAPAANKPPPARAAQNGTASGDGEEAQAGGRQRQAVNPDCPNAENPFHRCAEYCPIPPPAPAAVKTFPLPPGPGRELAQNGRTHSDGDLKPRGERRRDRAGGSGGLPLYVFLREGSDGEGKKVDPRCPNAANPFHVCTNHCLPKMVDAAAARRRAASPPFPSSPATPAAHPLPRKMAVSSPRAARRQIPSARMPAIHFMNVESNVLPRLRRWRSRRKRSHRARKVRRILQRCKIGRSIRGAQMRATHSIYAPSTASML